MTLSELGYSVWEEGDFYHWAVRVQRGPECGHGTTTSPVRARAEAIDFGLDPARAEDIARFEHRRRHDMLRSAERASADVNQRAVIAKSKVSDWAARCAMSLALIATSQDAIARTRQLLQGGVGP